MWCRIYQWQIERQIDDRNEQRSGRLTQHIERCPSCKRYADQLAHIRLHLGSTAPFYLQAEAVRPLPARVIDALMRMPQPEANMRRMQFNNPIGAKIFAGTLAASLMVVIGMLVLQMERAGSTITGGSTITIDAHSLQTPLPVVASWPEESMRQEAEQIGSDVGRAVEFLLNSLPAVKPAENEDEQ